MILLQFTCVLLTLSLHLPHSSNYLLIPSMMRALRIVSISLGLLHAHAQSVSGLHTFSNGTVISSSLQHQINQSGSMSASERSMASLASKLGLGIRFPTIESSLPSSVASSLWNIPPSITPGQTSDVLTIDGSVTTAPIATSIVLSELTTSNSEHAAPAVASTMTTVPPGVSTELITSTGITTNTWITTTKDESPTAVPVIWCPACGGAVVIWSVPAVAGVVFDWTAVFPSLPKFDLPCVRVFGVQVSGDCLSPETEDPQTEDQEAETEDEDAEEDDADDEEDSPSSTATATSDSTMSSTLSCSPGMSTVNDCRVGCSVSYSTVDNGISSTTMCYTTSCQQTVGCDLQGTTSITISSSALSDALCPFQPAQTYDAYASYSAMGIDLPAWLAYSLTHEFSPDDEATVSEDSTESSTSATTSTLDSSSVDMGQIKSLVLSLMPPETTPNEGNKVTAVKTTSTKSPSSADLSSDPDHIRSLVLSLMPSEPSPNEANVVTAVQTGVSEPSSSSDSGLVRSLVLSLMPAIPILDEQNKVTAIQTNPAEPTLIATSTSTTEDIEFPVRCESVCAVYGY
jgi:hypothetical protein